MFTSIFIIFLNSGGRNLPGEPFEIDFRSIWKHYEKSFSKFSNYTIILMCFDKTWSGLAQPSLARGPVWFAPVRVLISGLIQSLLLVADT